MGSQIDQLIDQAIMSKAKLKTPRDYLGASIAGSECDRQLWYKYKMPKDVEDPRVHRIFAFGHILEDYLIGLIKEAGMTIYTTDDDGNQFRFEDGILAGSCDGVIMIGDEPHLFEAKSYNNARFETLKKETVKHSDYVYFAQVQLYMHYFELDKSLFMAINKNTSELYYETVEYCPIEANYLINRAKEIGAIEDGKSVNRKYGHRSHFKCKFCSYAKECWSESDNE